MASMCRTVARRINFVGIRGNTTAPASEIDEEWNSAKPFSEIPGPKPLPIPKYGNFWRFIRPFGEFAGKNNMEMIQKLVDDYGPIVKLCGIGRPDMIMLTDPSDVEKVFRSDSVWPKREALNSVDYYRRHVRRDDFKNNVGLITAQGEEWRRNRTLVNQPMMRPTNVLQYHDGIQKVSKDFLERIRSIRDDKLELPADFLNELNKWVLESTVLIALDTRLGCLDGNLKPDSEAQIMIDSVADMFDLMYKLDFQPSLWKYVSTSNWRKMVRAMDIITNTSLRHINNKFEEIVKRPKSEQDGRSILETLLRGEGGKSTAITMAIDMINAGIDSTSISTAIPLYYISKNADIQEKLFEEVKGVMPKRNDVLPSNYSSKMPYLKACVKESQRLTPAVSGNLRSAGKDIVIQGYQVPKGTYIAMLQMIMCNRDEHFPQSGKFIPERWLKSETGPLSSKNSQPFVFLPFGFGPRMCIGKRFAELQMHTLISLIIRNFKVSYEYGDMTWQSNIITAPAYPLKFKMEERPN